MHVGVLGSSDVGQALGRGFAGRGHDVKLGSRTPKSEALTTWLKEVKVKASTTVPNTQMVDPKFVGGAPEMLIAGNDAVAKKQVVGILKEFGWPGAIDVGGIEGARWIEALVPLWALVGSATNRWDHAFKVVHG